MGQPGCRMTTNHANDVKLDHDYQVTFSGEHGIPGTMTFPLHTTAQFAVSTYPHWGILFEGQMKIGPRNNQKNVRFVLLDLYIDEIRFQGHNDAERLLQG